MSDLDQKIEEARAAERKVAEMAQVEALAAQLPELERQKQEAAQRERAYQDLARTKEEARVLLEQARPKAQAWNADFQAAVEKLQKLAAELPEAQAPILKAGRMIRAASLAAHSDTESNWRAVGGLDPGLDLFPEEPPNRFFAELVTTMGLTGYSARRWHRFF